MNTGGAELCAHAKERFDINSCCEIFRKSQEKCLLGCWSTNACKWVYNIFASKFADCNGIDITRLYILSPGYASYSPGYTSYSEQECAVLRGVTGQSCD